MYFVSKTVNMFLLLNQITLSLISILRISVYINEFMIIMLSVLMVMECLICLDMFDWLFVTL